MSPASSITTGQSNLTKGSIAVHTNRTNLSMKKLMLCEGATMGIRYTSV